MRSQPSSWTIFLTKLGFTRKKQQARRRTSNRQTLRFEQFEERCLLATFMVLNDSDAAENTQVELNSLKITGADSYYYYPAIRSSGANLSLKDVTISGNAGGGLAVSFATSLVVENCTITGNDGRHARGMCPHFALAV